jgi:hypothetical protein
VTPHEFVGKWRGNALTERASSQTHFNDLCALLGVLDPKAADPDGEWFTFEKGVSKTGGGEGWADVWRRGCFAWEYKGPKKDLDAALMQLLHYNAGLEHPPLLIVSDTDRIRVHTNWTNTVQEVHEFALDALLDGAVRERLKAAFVDPEEFKPKKSRQALSEAATQARRASKPSQTWKSMRTEARRSECSETPFPHSSPKCLREKFRCSFSVGPAIDIHLCCCNRCGRTYPHPSRCGQ